MSQYLSALASGIGITDVIDIAIISYIVYRLLGFVKTSRAEQLGKGIIVLVVIFLVSGKLHLYAVNWILKQILSIGAIALIIVFQPELRRGLEYLGRGSISFKQLTGEVVENPIIAADAITKAISSMSASKTGALIVIERKTALSDITEHGTIVDANLSDQLLENIFYEGSPLHDGAVIIRNDRIYAAACVLPLTENPNLSKDLGTRHRAGIGITEQSDALVFIVSEETGIISMVEDGKISRFLDIKTVEKTLLTHYMSNGNDKKGIVSVLNRKKGGGANE